MKGKKISTKTFRQRVYEKLREKIISAEILPGETITMRELAGIFGVSLMPVREALWQLESEKVIVIESNRSIHVNSLSPEDIRDIFEIRVVLEGMAARRACELRPKHILPKAEYYLDGMRKNIENHRQYLFNNSQFHFIIYSSSNSPILIQQIHSLWARIGPYLSIQYAKGGDIGAAMK
jgi:DNA-binding GntR family transcriptional regulator